MTSTVTYCVFLKDNPKHLDQDESINVLDQAVALDPVIRYIGMHKHSAMFTKFNLKFCEKQ
jgi:hypothetical protein